MNIFKATLLLSSSFVSVCGVREKEREVSCTSVYYHLLVAECQALRIPFPRQYSHISSFRVAMFVFAIANIKTARARPIPPFLVPFPEEGNAPISYSGAPSRDIIPHRCRDSYENRGESHIFRTKFRRNAYRFEIARGLTFLRRLLLLYFALWEIVELQGLPDTTS